MKEVIIYGGAFNPPTIAHQAIAQAAADFAFKNDMELWLLPSGERRDKTIGVHLEKRLSYAHALLASLSTVATTQVCDIELKNDSMTQTIDTFKALRKNYPDTQFTWLFGSDSVLTMDQWVGGSWIKEQVPLLVVQRPGYEVEMQKNMRPLKVPQLSVSSSDVRERHESGLSVSELVPASVLPLI